MKTRNEILEAFGAEKYKREQKIKALETNEDNHFKLVRQIEGHSEAIKRLEQELKEII